MSSNPRIGFIGLGLMGLPMAQRLIEAGYHLKVWNRTREKLDAIIENGAMAMRTPGHLASQCDLVFMCLMDAIAIETVVFGQDGVASANGPTILVDCSTLHPDKCREFAERLHRANGTKWVDAPVSGGVPGATDGTLAIMAGGDENDTDALRPIMTHLSARFTRMGPVGAGQTTKLCNQIIAGCTISIVAEAVNFAKKSGVDASALTEALKGGFADSIPFQLFAPRMAARDFDNPLGTANTMRKDLESIVDVAAARGITIPMVEQALGIYDDMDRYGDGEKDISAIIDYFDRQF